MAAEWRTEPLSLLSFKQQEEQNANWCLQAFEHTVAFSHLPLRFQAHWPPPIPALIILGHHCVVTSVFPLPDCEPTEAGPGWLRPCSPQHVAHTGGHSANVREIRNLKRGQEVIVTEMCLTQIPLSGYTADWLGLHNTLWLTVLSTVRTALLESRQVIYPLSGSVYISAKWVPGLSLPP